MNTGAFNECPLCSAVQDSQTASGEKATNGLSCVCSWCGSIFGKQCTGPVLDQQVALQLRSYQTESRDQTQPGLMAMMVLQRTRI